MHYNIMDSLLFFLIYGFLGFLLETVFRSIADRKVYISRGFLTNGFCPLYGICALLIIEGFILCELSLSNPLTAMIVATAGSIFLVTLIEYIAGRMLDRVFHYKLWDYSAYRLNLHSYICLEFSLLWGIMALLLVYFVHPVMEVLVFAIPYNIRAVAVALFLSMLIINASYQIRKRVYGG